MNQTPFALLAGWLSALGQSPDAPAGLSALGALQAEQLAPGPGWGITLVKNRLQASRTLVTGTVQLHRRLLCLVQLRLPAPEGDAASARAAAELCEGLAAHIDRAGRQSPPALGQEPLVFCTAAAQKTPGEGGLWAYTIGLCAAYTEILTPKGE